MAVAIFHRNKKLSKSQIGQLFLYYPEDVLKVIRDKVTIVLKFPAQATNPHA